MFCVSLNKNWLDLTWLKDRFNGHHRPVAVPDPELENKWVGPRSSRPLDNWGGSPKIFFFALQASVLSENKGGRALHWIRHWVDNPPSKPTTVSEHFLTDDHSANDITLIPLELIQSNRESVRKARAAYLIERERQNSWTIRYHLNDEM